MTRIRGRPSDPRAERGERLRLARSAVPHRYAMARAQERPRHRRAHVTESNDTDVHATRRCKTLADEHRDHDADDEQHDGDGDRPRPGRSAHRARRASARLDRRAGGRAPRSARRAGARARGPRPPAAAARHARGSRVTRGAPRCRGSSGRRRSGRSRTARAPGSPAAGARAPALRGPGRRLRAVPPRAGVRHGVAGRPARPRRSAAMRSARAPRSPQKV